MIENSMQQGKIRVTLDEVLFFLAFIPYLMVEMLGTTMFPIPRFSYTVAKGLLIFALTSSFFKKKWSLQFMATSFILLLVGVLVERATSDTKVIAVTLLIMGAYKVKITKIIKIYLVLVITIMTLAFLASMLDIIPNLQYIRPQSGIVRNSFGIVYPTDFAAHIFYIYLFSAYLYFKNHPFIFSFLGVFAAGFLIKFCDARLDALTILGTTFLFLIVRYAKKITPALMRIAPFVTIATAGLSYYLSKHFRAGNPFYAKLNGILSGRLKLGRDALNMYGNTPFGQQIDFIGNGRSTESTLNYNFVDSSYLKLALLFGFVFMLIFVFLMTLQGLTCRKRRDYYTLAVLVAISINSMVAHHLIEVSYNVFAISFFAEFAQRQINSDQHTSLIESQK